MASGDMRWEYHSDELSKFLFLSLPLSRMLIRFISLCTTAPSITFLSLLSSPSPPVPSTDQTFGCTLHIPISTSSLLSYTSDKIYTSHSSARDAAASKALADDVPGRWEAAYEERFCVDGKGYIKLSMSSPVVEAGKEDTAEQSERVDAVAFLQHECWSALGGVTKWIRWTYQASPQLCALPSFFPPSPSLTFPSCSLVRHDHVHLPPASRLRLTLDHPPTFLS